MDVHELKATILTFENLTMMSEYTLHIKLNFAMNKKKSCLGEAIARC